SRRRHTRSKRDWSSDVCSSDLYENLVDTNDHSKLEQGKHVMKEGFVEELNKEILGAIFPIKGEQGLIGFIYIYVPLTAVQDVFQIGRASCRERVEICHVSVRMV